MKSQLILAILSLAVLTQVLGQSKGTTIDGVYQNTPFITFYESVQSQTDYHLYFDINEVDSLMVTYNANSEPLLDVLNKVLENTNYSYVLKDNKISIVKGLKISNRLPIGFFDQIDSNENNYDAAIFDFIEDKSVQKKAKQIEVIEIGEKINFSPNNTAKITGQIRDKMNGEALIGATIFHDATSSGVVTDPLGNFSISLPTGKSKITISSIGMATTTLSIFLYSNGSLNIELEEQVTSLNEVVIQADRGVNLTNTQMGVEKLDMKTIKQVPMVMGEVDVMRVILTLPGVQSAGESSTGLNVRGGTTSQNLILFNGATIYNSSHLFGFFSAFNPDVIKNVELYKSGIPAKYGGRLSSVLEVTSKEGNKKKFSGSGGIGPVTGRITLEAPIIKEKTSLLVGARSSYSDWLLSRIPNDDIKNSSGSFYDVHANISHKVNEKNNLFLSGYYSRDQFKLNNDTSYTYNNKNASIQWKRIFNKSLFGIITASASQYNYDIESSSNSVNAFVSTYKIDQRNLKADFSHYYNSKHSFSYGMNIDYFKLKPTSLLPVGNESEVSTYIAEDERGVESSLYFGDDITISPKLSLYFALRYSVYNYLGDQTIENYVPGLPKGKDTVTDTTYYKKGDVINTYHGPEFRFSTRYAFNESTSFKISFHRMRQYIHMLSTTTSIAPTDIWKLSDPNILPEIGDQISLGAYKNFNNNTLETSIEVYYKNMQNSIDFKDGAQLFLNSNIERDIVNAQGKAYGVEFMIKKVSGKLNGWISYTYSRSLLRTDEVNFGNYYPSSYDKPHDFTLISNYKVSRRLSLSFNFTYSTGRPITLPLGQYETNGSSRLFFSQRNQFRIPDYYRTDVSVNVEGNHKLRKLAHGSWSFSVYNLLGRKNAYSVFYRSENNGQINGYKLSIFGQPIPTITYNFKF